MDDREVVYQKRLELLWGKAGKHHILHYGSAGIAYCGRRISSWRSEPQSPFEICQQCVNYLSRRVELGK